MTSNRKAPTTTRSEMIFGKFIAFVAWLLARLASGSQLGGVGCVSDSLGTTGPHPMNLICSPFKSSLKP